jgi:hypothetical protein
MTGSRNALARLVLVDVTWWQWRPDTDRDRYGAILSRLVDPPDHAPPYGPVHVHQCGDGQESHGIVPRTRPEAPYELPPPDRCRCPDTWLEGADGKGWALKALAGQQQAERDRMAPIPREPDRRRLFRTRVAMGAGRFRAMASCEGTVDYAVLIDMRFQWVSADVTLWHTSFSVWSDLPWNGHHWPASDGVRGRHTLSKDSVLELIDDYTRHSRTAFRELIGERNRDTLRVFGRDYKPPGFLVAVRDPRKDDDHGPDSTPDDSEAPDIMRTVANTIVRTQRYKALPRGQVRGGVEVFRRFLAAGDRDRPRYLLIPDTRVSAQASGVERQTELRRIQEEAAATGIVVLTDLEAFAASQLGDIDARMRTRENHLRIYRAVAGQAGALWDALARLLPDSRRPELEIVQRAIELLHQTLLQGVADLDQLVRAIDSALSRIEVTADEITDRFDRELHHPDTRRSRTLRRSLRGGYIDRLRRHVRELSGTATRVTDSYRMLLDTIGLAFDERSAREGDRVQKAGIWLAVGFGVLGLSGVAQATAPLPDVQQPWLLWLVRSTVWLLALTVLGLMGWRLAQPVYRMRRITKAFTQRYRYVRDFLSHASTDRLNQFRRQHDPDGPGQQNVWHDLDGKLSTEFLQAWQQADEAEEEAKKKAEREPDGARALRARVEAWTLRTLLLTERPRDFEPYRLPILTSLYRLCSARELQDWGAAGETPDADSAVGIRELQRVLQKWGYAGQCRHLLENETTLLERTPAARHDELKRIFAKPSA